MKLDVTLIQIFNSYTNTVFTEKKDGNTSKISLYANITEMSLYVRKEKDKGPLGPLPA